MNTATAPAVPETAPRPWWRFGMMWLVVGGPLAVVIASFATLMLALSYPDPVIESRDDTAADVRQIQSETPALKARNHAATGGR